jgi:hypothetical protein
MRKVRGSIPLGSTIRSEAGPEGLTRYRYTVPPATKKSGVASVLTAMRVDATFGLPRDNAGKGSRMRIYRIAAAVALTACVGLSAGEAAAKDKRVFVVVNKTAGVPVFAGDISNRPYRVIGEVSAGVRKATVFSKASSEAKIFR